MASEKTIYPPKITLPRTRNVLERQRLFTQLDEAREQASLIWLSAPGGSGKTTLVSSYLQNCKPKSIWYQIDEGDVDPATFFHYLGLAGKKATPRRKTAMPVLTPEYLQGLPTFTRRFFEELAARLGTGGIIVFDNFQLIDEEGGVAELLEMMAEAVAGQLTIIVVSRSRAPEKLIGLRARGMLHEIDVESVRFTKEEWLAVSDGKDEESKNLLALHQMMDGWISGLLLCGSEYITAHGGEGKPDIVNEPMFNYFAVEFFHRLDEASQKFLLRCAFLYHFNEASARELSGVDSTPLILKKLLKRNYFIQRQGSGSYTLHPLFQSYLQTEAQLLLSDDEFRYLILDSATTLVKQGEYEPAAELYIRLQAWNDLALLIAQHAEGLYTQGRFPTLHSWLEALPEDEKNRHDWLLFWEAALLSYSDVAQCLDKLDPVFDQFHASGDEQGAWRCWLLAVELMNKSWMETERLAHWLQRHDQCRKIFGPLPPASIETSVIANIALGHMISCHDPVATEYWLEQLDQVVAECKDEVLLATLLSCGLFSCVVLGYLIKAKQYLIILNELHSVDKMGPLMHLHVLSSRMLGECFAGEPWRCLELYEEAQKFTAQYGVYIFEGVFQHTAIVSCLTMADTERAKQHIEILEKIKHQAVMNEVNHYWGKAQLMLFEENFESAAEYARACSEMTQKLTIPTYSLLSKISLIEACREQGEINQALTLLEEASGEAERLRLPLAKIRIHLMKARFAMDNDDPDEAKQQLSLLFKIVRHYGMHTFPGWVPGRLISWACHMAIQWGIEIKVVQHYVRTLILWIAPPSNELENWPWPVRISTLNGFHVEVNDVPINVSAKRDSRPYRLLEALVELGGNSSVSQLIEYFYQQDESNKIQQQFHTHLYRLRKQLGHDEAILVQGDRIKLNPQLCWLDVEAFEQASQTYLAQTEAEETERAWQTIFTLYRGEYLADSNNSSEVMVQREHLRTRFLQTVFERLEHNKNEEQAMELCQQVLKVEPLAEPLYRYLIKLYLKQGRRDMAETIYAQCRRLLLSHLDIEPTAQTQALLNL